jgi:hypothetical protein
MITPRSLFISSAGVVTDDPDGGALLAEAGRSIPPQHISVAVAFLARPVAPVAKKSAAKKL